MCRAGPSCIDEIEHCILSMVVVFPFSRSSFSMGSMGLD